MWLSTNFINKIMFKWGRITAVENREQQEIKPNVSGLMYQRCNHWAIGTQVRAVRNIHISNIALILNGGYLIHLNKELGIILQDEVGSIV